MDGESVVETSECVEERPVEVGARVVERPAA